MKVFVTGTAGFVGFHLARRLLADGHAVTGYDGVTDYYNPALKRARLAILAQEAAFTPSPPTAPSCSNGQPLATAP